MKSLEHISFPEHAERVAALYNYEEDALLLGMLGQEYIIRHTGVVLHGQRAPESHAQVLFDYLLSSGSLFREMPWRALADLAGEPVPNLRQRVEAPLAASATEIIARANAILPMIDARKTTSILGSELAFTVRALPKVSLHVELAQESQDFPAEAWVLFSNNAHEFVGLQGLQTLAEIFKDRLLSLLRIY